jgi:hypothetical protein
VKEYLSRKRVPFEERDLKQNPDARQQIRNVLDDEAHAITVLGTTSLVGFDPEALDSLIESVSETP